MTDHDSAPDAARAPGDPTPSQASLEELIAVASMAVLALITFVNVIVRYLTDESIAWTEEISIVLMVVLTLAGAAAASGRDRNVRIEFFYSSGSQARQRVLALVSSIATALLFVLLAGLFTVIVRDEFHYGETSMAIGVPRWWYSIWIPPLCLAIAARALLLARKVWRTR